MNRRIFIVLTSLLLSAVAGFSQSAQTLTEPSVTPCAERST